VKHDIYNVYIYVEQEPHLYALIVVQKLAMHANQLTCKSRNRTPASMAIGRDILDQLLIFLR
jgi:hypothetical protein